MSAVLQAREPSGRYLAEVQPALLRQFELLATAPSGVARLRELILALAVQGKLVRQGAREEPAAALLERIAKERARLTATGGLRRSKDSSAEVSPEPPYSLPPGWTWSTLAAVGVINPRNDAEDDVVASFVQMSSIPIAFNDQHATEPRPWRDIKSGFTPFAEGDVGVAKITPCFENGKSTVFQNLSNGIGAGTTELHIVRPLCGIQPRYVLLFLKSPGFLRDGEATMTGTAGQKRLPRAYFENCPFPLPPLAEQASIVARVDELMHLCDALEAKGRLEAEQHARLLDTLLGTLTDSSTPEELSANWQRVADHFDLLLDRPEAVDSLEQTILQLAVRGLLVPQDPSEEPASELLARIAADRSRLIAEGKLAKHATSDASTQAVAPFDVPTSWRWVEFATYIHELCTGPFGSVIHKEDYVQGGVPLINPSHMIDGVIRHDPSISVPPSLADRLGAYRLSAGDVLMARRGEVGRYALVTDREGGWLCGTGSFFVRLASFCNREYFGLMLEDPRLRAHLLGESVGATMTNLNQRILLQAPIAVPPLYEQARIVGRVTELRGHCADLRQRLATSQIAQSRLAEALVAGVP